MKATVLGILPVCQSLQSMGRWCPGPPRTEVCWRHAPTDPSAIANPATTSTPPPTQHNARWEGRPKTPPFHWSDDGSGERVLPHDAWLTGLDLGQEGLGALQEPEFLATDPGAGEADLARAKDVLVRNAGAPAAARVGPRRAGMGDVGAQLEHDQGWLRPHQAARVKPKRLADCCKLCALLGRRGYQSSPFAVPWM
jgi:hypothetical protein